MENTGRNRNFDRRMTGASVIDEALQEVSKCILDAANISLISTLFWNLKNFSFF